MLTIFLYPAFAQSRVENKYLIQKYIVEIDSIFGVIQKEFYPEMNVSFTPPLGCYDTLDQFIVSHKGNIPYLPFYYNIMGKVLSVNDKGFEAIAIRYKDTCYHRTRYYPWRGEIDGPVINDTLLEIHILCDQDYDSLHPKDCYLDDIVAISYEKHIMDPLLGYRLINKPALQLLNDYNLNYSHAYMLPSGFWGLLKPPAKAGKYFFKFILITENRRRYELNYAPVCMSTKVSFFFERKY